MTIGKRPTWQIIQENAAAAEARTRAFLLDRFWILERSIDADGADLIIQCRLTTKLLFDRHPPIFGAVQCKHYQDRNTTQYLHSEYVIDECGRPYDHFFLMCHSGKEDDASAFFLPAAEIVKHFHTTGSNHSKPNRFALPGTQVLSDRFRIVDRARVLDQMEATLRDADFVRNRRFLSWALPSVRDEEPAIRKEYVEKIDNWWGDISEHFQQIKRDASSEMWDLERIAGQLRKIATSNDPESALAEAEDLLNDDVSGLGEDYGRHLFDEEFLRAARYHRRRHRQLEEAGLLGAHAQLRRETLSRIVSDVAPRMPLPSDLVYLLRTTFDPRTLTLVNHECRFLPVGSPVFSGLEIDRWREGILSVSNGEIEIYLIPGRYGYEVNTNKSWEEELRPVAEGVIGDLFARILAQRFGEWSPEPIERSRSGYTIRLIEATDGWFYALRAESHDSRPPSHWEPRCGHFESEEAAYEAAVARIIERDHERRT